MTTADLMRILVKQNKKKTKKKSKPNQASDKLVFTNNLMVLFSMFATLIVLIYNVFTYSIEGIHLTGRLKSGGGVLDGQAGFRSRSYYFELFEYPGVTFTMHENENADLDLDAYMYALREKKSVQFDAIPSRPIHQDQNGVPILDNNKFDVYGMIGPGGQIIMDAEKSLKVRKYWHWGSIVLIIFLVPLTIMLLLKVFREKYRYQSLYKILKSYFLKQDM